MSACMVLNPNRYAPRAQLGKRGSA